MWRRRRTSCRVYSGAKFHDGGRRSPAGHGVRRHWASRQTYPGQGLGVEADRPGPASAGAGAHLPAAPAGGVRSPHGLLRKLRQLEEEDPQLHLLWDEARREIHVQLMGEVQLEVLQRLIQDRFGRGRQPSDQGSIVLQGDHRRPGGGGGPLRAPAPLRRGPPAAGAPGAAGQRPGAGHPPAREDVLDRPLAAAHPHPPGRSGPTGGCSPGPPSRT